MARSPRAPCSSFMHPASAIIAGLPGGVIEKNQDSALLSPSALMRAARGKVLTLKRIDPATGKQVLVPGEILSASADGVMFRTAGGIEALRCSGLPCCVRKRGPSTWKCGRALRAAAARNGSSTSSHTDSA